MIKKKNLLRRIEILESNVTHIHNSMLSRLPDIQEESLSPEDCEPTVHWFKVEFDFHGKYVTEIKAENLENAKLDAEQELVEDWSQGSLEVVEIKSIETSSREEGLLEKEYVSKDGPEQVSKEDLGYFLWRCLEVMRVNMQK